MSSSSSNSAIDRGTKRGVEEVEGAEDEIEYKRRKALRKVMTRMVLVCAYSTYMLVPRV
jgi:hypothetical protein